jgi:prepilin-type N-terminal cleavage/methylation domain-containing protein
MATGEGTMRKGFTLIELMIVVVIIGVLAAIAIPKFTSIQDLARQSACRGNMRTLATAEAVYFPMYNCFTNDINSLAAVQENAPLVVCPESPETGAYVLQVPDPDEYVVVCPDNGVTLHGSVASGITSWQSED